MEHLKSNELKGFFRCRKFRENRICLSGGKANEARHRKNIILKRLISKCLREQHPVDGRIGERILEELKEAYQELPYPTEKTRELQAEAAQKRVMRYLQSESRTPEFAPEKTVPVPGMDGVGIDVSPDFIFRGEKLFETEIPGSKPKKKVQVMMPYVEAVKIRDCAPDVTVSGKKQDASVKTCLELYAMLLYARDIAGSEACGRIGASYYYLKRADDSKEVFEEDFFAPKGRNVVSLWEIADDHSYDQYFQPQIQEFLDGEERIPCSKDSCRYCPLLCSCSFAQPVSRLEEKGEKVASLQNISLTPPQAAAIAFRKGTARINAGAGTGKTLVTALRVAQLLKEGVKPSEICMLTFTDTGAGQMRERVRQYADEICGCPVNVDALVSTTFNSFGYQLVRRNYGRLGYEAPPRLASEIEKSMVIQELLDSRPVEGLDYNNFSLDFPHAKGAFSVVKEAFAVMKENRVTVGDGLTLKSLMHGWEPFVAGLAAWDKVALLYGAYQEELFSRCLIEYADQELLVFRILEDDPGLLSKLGFRHIMVDEFQDTNEVQFLLLEKLTASPSVESFMVVGDDSQAIFGFRGSTPEFIIDFYRNLKKDGTDFYLLDNQRSTPEIVGFANAVNRLNKHRVEKDLVAVRPSGVPVEAFQFWGKEEELQFIIGQILQYYHTGESLEQVAFLAATNAELDAMAEALEAAGIPYAKRNPEQYLSNPRVKAAVSLARFFRDTDDEQSAFEFLNCQSGNTLLSRGAEKVQMDVRTLCVTAELMEDYPDKADETFSSLLESLDEGHVDEIYSAFLKEVYEHAGPYQERITYILQYETFGAKATKKKEGDYPGISLVTAHSAKGLEWPYVFVSLSKFYKKDMTDEEIEERRRLLFVSATRARDRLVVTGQTVACGTKTSAVFNPFLEECFGILDKPFTESFQAI